MALTGGLLTPEQRERNYQERLREEARHNEQMRRYQDFWHAAMAERDKQTTLIITGSLMLSVAYIAPNIREDWVFGILTLGWWLLIWSLFLTVKLHESRGVNWDLMTKFAGLMHEKKRSDASEMAESELEESFKLTADIRTKIFNRMAWGIIIIIAATALNRWFPGEQSPPDSEQQPEGQPTTEQVESKDNAESQRQHPPSSIRPDDPPDNDPGR